MWPSRWRRPSAHGDCGAVSCNNIYATRAGLEMLRAGGNAFDAAVAVSLTLSVVEPHHSGIGGGCFSLLYSQRDQKVLALDAGAWLPPRRGRTCSSRMRSARTSGRLGGQSVAIAGLLRAMENPAAGVRHYDAGAGGGSRHPLCPGGLRHQLYRRAHHGGRLGPAEAGSFTPVPAAVSEAGPGAATASVRSR